jgi:two-component system chemotaxis sensor kinase CheA
VEQHAFALPTIFVEAVERRVRRDVVLVDGRSSIVYESEPVPLAALASLLQIPHKEDAAPETLQIVVLSAGGMRVAAVADRVIDDRDVIVRDTGLTTDFAGLSAGAVPLEDGRVAVVLNVVEVLQEFERSGGAAKFEPPQTETRKSRILVVDDSITTRPVERGILEASGYEVELAVDGLDALEKVHRSKPDLIISDVAMPHLDGFQLLERLKAEKETAAIPVILVTSLEQREEQERGLSLGADAYIVKRKFDQRALVATVRQIL